MINKLRNINNELIKLNYNNLIELEKYELIKKLLQDDNCFMKIDINTAYAILKDLKIPEEHLKDIYIQLLEINN